MSDIYKAAKRSSIMSLVRSSGNLSTEMRLITSLRANHITGWRRRVQLVGRPDFVFVRQRVAVFVDGCFWHCCPKHSRIPASNRRFWRLKLAASRERDRSVTRALRKQGWHVLRVWEHDLKRRDEPRLLRRIRLALRAAGRVSTGRRHRRVNAPRSG